MIPTILKNAVSTSEPLAKTSMAERITIGPDVLELVSTAMYIDPRALFREYLQNSADSIDQAVIEGVIKDGEGRVDVVLDISKRSIRILDNGMGIDGRYFYESMTGLGSSAKRGTASRGFRGIGRLSGLGYARKLTFRTRTPGEPVSEISWNCLELRKLLRSSNTGLTLPELIDASTEYRSFDSEDYDDRFFEVELEGVPRLRNDVLLNVDLVCAYIAEVCPVPFHPQFKSGKEIETILGQRVSLGNLAVFVNEFSEPIFRPHRDIIELDDGRQLTLQEIEPVELVGLDGNLAAIGWIAHHEYQGAIPGQMGVKGARLRVGNMQIGGNHLFEGLFSEGRFNSWTVSELHVVDDRLIPNARRDDLERNAHWLNLTNQFLPVARKVSTLCRDYSIRRNWIKRFELAEREANDRLAILEQRILSKLAQIPQVQGFKQGISEMKMVESSTLFTEMERSEFAKRRQEIEQKFNTVTTDDVGAKNVLNLLDASERKTYERIFSLIYDCSTNRVAARNLVDKILERIAADQN